MKLGNLLFSFKGRVNRMPFWLYHFARVVIEAIIFVIFVNLDLENFILELESFSDPESYLSGLFFYYGWVIILSLIFIWFDLAVYVKRWHDRDKSYRWFLIILVPVIGPIWAFVELFLLRGTVGPNRFGPDPLARCPRDRAQGSA